MPDAITPIWTLHSLKIATWSAGDSYGSDVTLQLQQKLTVDPQMDQDTLKAGGYVRRLLAVFTMIEGTLGAGEINWEAIYTLTGVNRTFSDSGGAAETITTAFAALGGNEPYFGLLGRMYSDSGSDVLVGLYKAMCQKRPSIMLNDQNRFVMTDTPIRAIARDSDNLVYKIQRRAGGQSTALPSVAAFLA